MARYRKEATGGFDETQIRAVIARERSLADARETA
jgi:transcriptional accessory protein Tex/SPT6